MMKGKMEELSNHGEFEKFIEQGKVVIDFWTSWCMPCVMMAPAFEEVAGKFKKIKFGKVNVDENKEIASKFKVMSIPTIIMFKDGKEIGRIVGSVGEEVLEDKIKKLK